MKDTRLRSVLVGFFTVLSLFTIGWFSVAKYAKTDSSRTSKISYWIDRIDAVGEKAAHDEYVAQMENLTQLEQHTQAHNFGEALYRHSGLKALSICDNRFAYGCFHQVIGMALSERGVGAIHQLEDVCIKKLNTIGISPNICLHSIGHGLIAYFGYGREGLERALDLCDELHDLDPNDPLRQCGWGALMEYNFRVMLDEDNSIRKLIDREVYYPCEDMSGGRQTSCFMALPQWWMGLNKNKFDDNRNLFKYMGDLCSALEATHLKDACFEGIGEAAALRLSESGIVRKEMCEAASANSSDQLLCKLHLVFQLRIVWHGQGRAAEYTDPVCSGLSKDAFARCDSVARGGPIF